MDNDNNQQINEENTPDKKKSDDASVGSSMGLGMCFGMMFGMMFGNLLFRIAQIPATIGVATLVPLI